MRGGKIRSHRFLKKNRFPKTGGSGENSGLKNRRNGNGQSIDPFIRDKVLPFVVEFNLRIFFSRTARPKISHRKKAGSLQRGAKHTPSETGPDQTKPPAPHGP